jgi:hypothetical protein
MKMETAIDKLPIGKIGCLIIKSVLPLGEIRAAFRNAFLQLPIRDLCKLAHSLLPLDLGPKFRLRKPLYQSPACNSAAFLRASALPPDPRLIREAIGVLIDEAGVLYG